MLTALCPGWCCNIYTLKMTEVQCTVCCCVLCLCSVQNVQLQPVTLHICDTPRSQVTKIVSPMVHGHYGHYGHCYGHQAWTMDSIWCPDKYHLS